MGLVEGVEFMSLFFVVWIRFFFIYGRRIGVELFYGVFFGIRFFRNVIGVFVVGFSW